MNDYIKRSDAIEETRKPWTTRAELRRRICNIPPANVRPVVLCRDCTHYSADSEMKCRHIFGLTEPDEDDFCSLGERCEGGTP